jgi:hypothetical protein
MSIPSNLYAEKIYSEHPISLWPLDDKCDYISLLNENSRDLRLWKKSHGAVELASVSDEPFPDSKTYKVIGKIAEDNMLETVEVISDNILNFKDLDNSLGSFSIGLYLKSLSPYFAGMEIGYQYNDTTSGETVKTFKKFNTTVSDLWIFGSETFMIPDQNTTFKIVLKFKYYGGSDQSLNNTFLVNGLSLGQWSEEFSSNSLGVVTQELPESIALEPQNCVEATAYGLTEYSGFYLLRNNGKSLAARNTGVPMVFGATGTTVLYENAGNPSLVIPGSGFMNELGKYNDYSFEMWLKVNGTPNRERRIFGPIGSDDGLYVDGGFLRLKIGTNIASHFVGEWFRPMLIHIRITKDSMSLLLNGSEVISAPLNLNTVHYLNEEINEGDGDIDDQDWLGFYVWPETGTIEIDCLAIYSYKIPPVVAKRRFAYGQAVEFSESINNAFGGTSIYFDYPFARYTNNYNYPDIGRWNQGILDNLKIENNILSVSNLSLPNIVLNKSTSEDFLISHKTNNIQNEQDNFITFGINRYGLNTFNNLEGHLVFDNLNVSTDPTKAVYGTFKVLSMPTESQTLFRIQDKTNSNYLSADIKNGEISYSFNYNGDVQILENAPGYVAGEIFSVGINIKTFSDYFAGNLSSFFGNPASLSVYVGGTKELQNTFLGNIYSFGFCNQRNLSKVKDSFGETGVVLFNENMFEDLPNTTFDADLYSRTFWDYILDGGTPRSFAVTNFYNHVATYTLRPRLFFDNFILDIDANAYWEDYTPLTYFAKYVEDQYGDKYYDLDFLQLNIDYPTPSTYKEVNRKTSSWTYKELEMEYQNPVQRDYLSLDNHLYTGYDNYKDLAGRAVKHYAYDTDSAIMKSYLTFQYITTGANANHKFFTAVEPANQNGVVQPIDNWTNTKYEFVNNMIAYPPKGIDFNDLALVIHLEFDIPGIISNPIKIKKLEIASQSFSSNSFNPIGTRFGEDVYPYQKSGIYYDYKALNPFSIYKGSSPYLYLTRTSGIELRGGYDPNSSRGISIPINKSKTNNYKLMAIQSAVRYDKEYFPLSPTEIFQIQDKDSLIKFYIVATQQDGKRGKIYGINYTTGQRENGLTFYINGNVVREPVISVNEWFFLGISFSKLLNFSNYLGSIKITGPLLFNTLSYYQSTRLQEVQKKFNRPWFKLTGSTNVDLQWTYWYGLFNWNEVLVLATTNLYGVDPSDIYKTHMGTNKIIVDDDQKIQFKSYEYSLYSEVLWNKTTEDAL